MYCIVNSIDPKDDDNDSDCSDSWELLDYEKEITPSEEVKNTTEKEGTPQPEKSESTSPGSLEDDGGDRAASVSAGSGKQKAIKFRGQNSNNNNGGKKKQKQKQKVSFEIPDLVKETKTIELTTPKEDVAEPSKRQSSSNRAAASGSKKKYNNELSSSSSANFSTSLSTKSIISRKVGTFVSKKKKNKENVGEEVGVITIDSLVEPTEKAQARPCARAPILNYAAALTAKLDKGTNKNEGKHVNYETLPEASSRSEMVAAQSKGVVKRNRPVSSSSWSSCDDEIIREISLVWEEDEVDKDEIVQETAKLDLLELPTNNNNDDGDSMVSSGFSDCDYGFGGSSDYVMRPKKSRAKKRRNVSATSSSLLTSVAKRGSGRAVEATTKKGGDSTSEVKDSAESSSAIRWETISDDRKRVKPKKKKLILSNPNATQSDFLKRSIDSVANSASTKSSPIDDQIETKTENASKVDNGRQLMPPPTSVPPSSTDSSDIPDMDESWYLTPPPCFTGAAANKQCRIPKPKAKEAARENLLIEHPSIYIASPSSKQVTLPSSGGKSTKEILIKQKAIVLKKVSSKQPSSSGSAQAADTETKSSLRAAKITSDKKSVKCWDNKFVVTDWDDDELGDVDDDFDNLFPALEKQPVASKAKKSATKEKPKQKSKQDRETKKSGRKSNSKLVANTSCDGYESDFSIPSPSSLEDAVGVDHLEEEEEKEKEVTDKGAIAQDENFESKRHRRNKSSLDDPKVLVKVEPIEPERQPGWQLKKKRSKRRPLISLAQVGPSMKNSVSAGKLQPSFSPYGDLSYAGSSECSARSTPTLINRIGSSIVANLSNLTSGFASSTGMNNRAPLSEATEKMNQIGLITKSESGLNSKARKQMSRGFLDRQNSCLKVGNSTRRADRRARMHTTPNGVSVNRKVHTNFH